MPKIRVTKARRILIYIIWCVSIVCPSYFTDADTTAVTPIGNGFGGYANGAVGFSFTPTNDIVVTQVGYRDWGAAAPIINFWSDTNFIFASFNLPPGSNTGSMIYTNVMLTLLAGQRYSIMLQDETPSVIISGYPDFQVASQLTNFIAKTVNSGGFGDATGFLEGPDFLFSNQVGTIAEPDLSIAQESPTNAIVFWPAPSTGFVLQQVDALDSTNWMLATNTVSTINGTNQISSLVTTSNLFFRLYHP